MKQQIQTLINQAINELQAKSELPEDIHLDIQIERARDKQHGDFASNIALMLAKPTRRNPRELAQLIAAALPESGYVRNVEIAGPGFINFFLTDTAQHGVIAEVLQQGENFGRLNLGAGKRIHIEYISANPTGPLHVGHGRGAAYGATLANLLAAAGYDVYREYYVNDAGRQMDILAASVWLRYLEVCGENIVFPSNGYKGDYVKDIAAALMAEHHHKFVKPSQEVFANLPADEPAGGDKEKHIDAIINTARELLGAQAYAVIHHYGLSIILKDIREDLAEFGVEYQNWFSERQLMESGAIEQAIEQLRQKDLIYERDGALWFNSIHFGDEKDRVIVRANGQTTYFASDIAYHMHKLNVADEIINVLGADHHGYIPRLRAAIQALGGELYRFETPLVQFAVLFRGGEKVQMSTRSGSFVTLRELREDVGNDAARFFYVLRKAEQHMDFDLDLAKSQSSDNPVYYVQYAHARICSVMRQLQEKGLSWDQAQGIQVLDKLTESHENELLMVISRYPEVIEAAAVAREPHQLAHYARELANHFHTYYNAHQFIVDDAALRNARLCLIMAAKQVLTNTLEILGVSTPEKM